MHGACGRLINLNYLFWFRILNDPFEKLQVSAVFRERLIQLKIRESWLLVYFYDVTIYVT